MNVLITGAGGFVGRHLVEHARAAGHSVTALLGPEDAPVSWPGVTALRGDVRDPEAVERAMSGAEALIHAAGPASVAQSFADPGLFASVHVHGTAVVMQAAVKAGLAAAVYISSAEIYGSRSGALVREEDPCQPISPYGAAKLGAESMARAIAVAAGLPLTILRPFSLYGPGQRQNSLLSAIVSQVGQREVIELLDLSPVRDYLYITDLCRLVEAALANPVDLRVLNACSGAGVSVGGLAETALRVAGARAVIKALGNQRPTDVAQLIGCRRRAMACLDWQPEVELAEGLRRLMAT